MTEGENARLVAWSREMREVHDRLREALRVTRDAVAGDRPTEAATRDLLLVCHGFCTALTRHHVGEDRALFPAIAAAHPHLRETLRSLEQDHSMIGYLLAGLQAAMQHQVRGDEIDRHLDGVAAIMESHFRYEERQLLRVLDDLDLHEDVRTVFGPV